MSSTIKKGTALTVIAILVIVAIGAGSYNVLVPPSPVTQTITQTRTQTVTQTGAVTQTITQPVTQTTTQQVTQTVTQTVTAQPTVRDLWPIQAPPAPPTPAPANKRDATFIWGHTGPPENFDPWHIGIGHNYIIYGMYDTLFMMGGDGKLYPSLATKLEKPDPLTYIVTLRKDVKFHDGTIMTAKDVKATYDRGIKQPLRRSYAVESIKTVEIIDDYTVKFTLKRRDADFATQLSSHTSIHTAARIEKLGEEIIKEPPMGTGPFKFVEYIPGDRFVLDRNEDYFGGPANVKRLVVRIIREEAVRALEVQRGGVHAMAIGDTRFVGDLEKAGMQMFASPPGFFTRDLAWKNQLPWAKDLNVRKAINYALDKKAIIDVIEGGRATPSIGPVPPWMVDYHNPNLKTGYEYNVAKAKELMAQSKYPNGFTVKLLMAGDQDETVAPILIANLGAIGIKIEVDRVDLVVKSRRNLTFEYEMTLVGWGGSAPSPQGTFEIRWHTSQIKPFGWNYFMTNETGVGKQIDALVEGFIVEDDIAKRKVLLEEFQKTVQENAIYATIAYRVIYNAASWQVKGYEFFPRHIFMQGIIHAPQVGVSVWLDPDSPISKK